MNKHNIPILVILLLLSSSFVGVSNKIDELNIDNRSTVHSSMGDDGLMNSSWPMKCHDNRHTSQSPYSTAHITGLEKWRFKCDGVDDSPIIGGDGTIYFGDKDADIYAVHPNGTLKWKYHTEDWITSAPALSEDGALYVGNWRSYFYALNSTIGEKIWRISLSDIISSSPAIGEDGTIYTATADGRVWAVNPNGTKKWDYLTEGSDIWGDIAIGDDGTLYIGTWNNYFFAINPNGTLKWKFKTGNHIKGPASIADDGTVYIGSWDDYLYALYPNNGTMKWKCKVGYGTETNPSIASDGTIYVGGDNLWAIYPNGTMKWSFDLGEGRHIHKSSPAISSEGTIYVGTNILEVSGGDIVAVNPNGTERWRKTICNEWCDSSPCIGMDGSVYIGSQDYGGYIHAFGPVESNSPPETPTISGETNGKVGESYWYTFKTNDPDNNPVSFYIEWGDGTSTGWTREWASGENAYYKYSWSEEGKYTIRCKTKDIMGEESDWAYLEVTVPFNKQMSTFPWIHWFLERFPWTFPILRQLLGLT
ncbi:MAG: PQQ-like beta-propeller repeat protein [Thermoplasmatales archaeon]|nr:MAG: PQQ-like beta-propeller repeat protein [Thermoplasmatales archaeon]